MGDMGGAYITPAWALTVGQHAVERIVHAELVSSRLRPFTVLSLGIDNAGGAAAEALREGDAVTLDMGTREGGLRRVFVGEVERIEAGRVARIEARDAGALWLARTTIVRSWMDVTPQEVARDVLRGREFALGATSLARRHRVVSRGSALDLLRSMATRWGLAWDLYCDEGGAVWWGPAEESPRARRGRGVAERLQLVRGESLLSLLPAVGGGAAETWLMPDIAHSAEVVLHDRALWRQSRAVRVDTVRHRFGESGGRTRFEWSEGA